VPLSSPAEPQPMLPAPQVLSQAKSNRPSSGHHRRGSRAAYSDESAETESSYHWGSEAGSSFQGSASHAGRGGSAGGHYNTAGAGTAVSTTTSILGGFGGPEVTQGKQHQQQQEEGERPSLASSQVAPNTSHTSSGSQPSAPLPTAPRSTSSNIDAAAAAMRHAAHASAVSQGK
jgi:hypothetical protein